MQIISYLLIILFILDNFFTYKNAIKYKKKFPEKDYTKIEINPLVRFMWKKLGLKLGGIISIPIQLIIMILLISFVEVNFLYILLGMYLMVILIHIDNSNLLNEEKSENKKIWTIPIMILSSLDIILTGIYITIYKNWSPNVPYSLMEWNKLYVLLWNNLGFVAGMIIVGVLVLLLTFYVCKKAHWLVKLTILLTLLFTMWNHINNFIILFEFIKKYPTGLVGF